MGPVERKLVVEVVYALPGKQVVLSVALAPGSTIQDALERSGIMRRFPRADFTGRSVGVFGKVRSRDSVLVDGDRVEIYRSLSAEPKEARRLRARRRPPGQTGR